MIVWFQVVASIFFHWWSSATLASALVPPPPPPPQQKQQHLKQSQSPRQRPAVELPQSSRCVTTRWNFLHDHAQTSAIVFSLAGLLFPTKPVEAAGPTTTKATTSTVVDNLIFQTAPSGLQYADAKVGTGVPITQKGSPVAIDYVMSTTGARYGTKIYSTSDKGAPYRFILGDGTTIAGLEQAIAGDEKGIVEPMRPGGIRRVIIPSTLGYESLARPIPGMQYQDCQEGKGVGPIPPVSEGTAGEYYQRFKNIYCNANRPYQPDLVMDIKLYGKR